MKKITLLTLLFVCAIGFSQQTETQLSDVDPSVYAQARAQQNASLNAQTTALSSLGERNAVLFAQEQTRIVNETTNTLLSGVSSYSDQIANRSTVQAPVVSNRPAMVINNSPNMAVVTYTDLATFQGAAGTLTSEDFSGGPVGITACGPIISGAGDPICFPAGELEDGFDVTASNGTDVILITGGQIGNTSVLVGANTFAEFTTITFTGDPVFAVGHTLWNNSDPDTDYRVYDTGGALLDSFIINETVASEFFFGVISDDAIGHIEIEGANASGELFGNFLFTAPGGGGGGGGACSQEVVSNGFENGLGDTNNGVEVGDDILVLAGADFTVEQLQVNIINTGGFNDVVVGFYEDAGGMPGAQIGAFQTVVPTSSTVIGTAFGRDVNEIVLDLTPVVLASDPVVDLVYWIGVETPNPVDPATDAYWETTSVVGPDNIVHADVNNGGWTANTNGMQSNIFIVSGQCAGGGGGGGGGCTAGVYTDRASFDAEAGTLVDEDLAGGPGGISACGEVISAAGDTCYAPGEIQAGIEITMNSPGVNTTVFVEAGNFGLTDDAVGSNTFVDYTIINFPGNDVNSFAFDLYGLTAGATMDIRIFGVGGLIATETVTDTGAGGGVFFGYIAAETVVSVEIEDLTGAAAELIAQISFGECVNAPPPPTCNLATYDATGLPADIDPGATSTSDCVAAPNLYPVTVGDAGTIGAGANIDNVTINITHTFDGDLDISLVSPLGTELLLSGGNGGGGDNFTNTVFMDGAGPLSGGAPPYTGTFAPDGGTFAATFDGEDITGDWSLKICDNFGGDTGTVDSFSITICIPPTNDECEFAYPIACGDVYVGSTLPDTDSGSNPAPDEFFTYTGSGSAEIVTLSLCDGGTDYDSFLRVFSDCTLANEIAANDDSCGLQSELSFLSDGTSTYVIMVEGFASSAGNFSLAVTCTDVAVNDECDDALPMACGDIVSGSTVNATFDAAAPVCTTAITAPGVWYVYEDTTGLVTDITLTMCNGTTDYDSKITVYTGDCGALVCETDNDDTCGLQSEVMFQSNGNETFYILVHGFGGATGNFELEMICAPIPPPNDMIANSIDVDEIGFPYTDPAVAMPAATTEAGGTPAGCDNAGVKGVWYNFVPEGDGTATAEIITPGPEGLEFSVNNGPLAGTYTAVAADFGGAFTSTPLTEDTAVVVDDGTSGDPNDACDPIQNGPSLVGKVAIVRRGACEFGVKALAAENEGAIAVIVVNNAPGDPIVMGGGAQGGNVTIPVLMVTDVDGEAIIAEVSGGGTVNVTMVLTPASFSSVTFYTAPNEMAVETDLTLVPWVFNQCVPGIEASINTVAGQAYYVYVANHGSITDIVIDGTNLGVTDNETIEGFSYYPNPADSTINLTSIDTIENVVIYNMLGQVVLNQNVGATISQLNVSNLATGAYIMKATVNGQTGTYKIIKR